MTDIIQTIERYGIIPVINVPEEKDAEPLAHALAKGGLPLIEVTMRHEKAINCLHRISQSCPFVMVGAGSILSVQAAQEAIAAGADFIVAPGLQPEVVRYCLAQGVPIFPGCATATEITAGRELGLKTFKFFPSEPLGGVQIIRELCRPFGDIRFIPTCGISMENMPEYMACEKVVAVGGSFMAPAEMIRQGDWEGITARCKEAVRISMGFRLMHVGINAGNEEEGEKIAARFAEIFDLPYKSGGRSDFAGTVLESCKVKFPGEKGHIAIGTYSVERASAYLQARGIKMREDFAKTDAKGILQAVYLEEEIGGFAIHLLRCI